MPRLPKTKQLQLSKYTDETKLKDKLEGKYKHQGFTLPDHQIEV